MTSPITDSVDKVAQYIIDLLKANVAVLKSEDNVAQMVPSNIYYGDQEKFPEVPAICVDPGTRPRRLEGVSYRSHNDFNIYIMFYFAKVDQSNQDTRKQIQQIAEAAETLIHQDPQFGGLLIHGFCELNESGYTYRAGTMYRSNRVTFSGYSKTRLR